jgi:hypothetical protein
MIRYRTVLCVLACALLATIGLLVSLYASTPDSVPALYSSYVTALGGLSAALAAKSSAEHFSRRGGDNHE